MADRSKSDHRLLTQITLDNFLSFGSESPALPLEPLNVFIGPNGAGKSNVIEALALLRATPRSAAESDVRRVLLNGGGAAEWVWKLDAKRPATAEVLVNNPAGKQPLRHTFSFRGDAGFRLADERVENATAYDGQKEPSFYYRFLNGRPAISTADGTSRRLSRETVDVDLSILAQRRDPESYPELAYLAAVYEQIRIYREWSFGRNTVFRDPQKADMRNDRLAEDFSNLGLFLNRLSKTPKVRRAILEHLTDLYDAVTGFDVAVEGGSVQVFFTEGDFTVPATRLSDGTLRYLCLLAILCDPAPPPLICIEEPELGLHPDIIPKLADLLVAAARRTQLIVTTHSDILVDAMTDRPGAVVVCEKHDHRTEMRRLDPAALAVWLEKYRLGELWTNGTLGGTRW